MPAAWSLDTTAITERTSAEAWLPRSRTSGRDRARRLPHRRAADGGSREWLLIGTEGWLALMEYVKGFGSTPIGGGTRPRTTTRGPAQIIYRQHGGVVG